MLGERLQADLASPGMWEAAKHELPDSNRESVYDTNHDQVLFDT